MTRWGSVLLAGIWLLGWGASAAAGKEGFTADFPLNPGSRWEYVNEDGTLETLAVTGSIVVRQTTLTQVTRDSDPPFFLLRCRDGVLRFDSQPGPGHPPSVPCLILKEPLEVGQEWTCAMTDPPLAFTVLSRGPFSVAAGHFPDAAKVAYRPASSPIYEGFIWFVPSVGFVATEEDDNRSELVTYSVSDLLEPPAAEASAAEVVARLSFSAPPPPAAGSKQGSGIENALLLRLPSLLLGLIAFLAIALLLWQLKRRSIQIDLDDLPEVQRGQTSLAAAMIQEGLYGDAAAILQRLAEKNPQWPDLACQLGRAYLFQGRTTEAIRELKRALSLNPQMSSARMDLARAYIKTGDAMGALEEIETVLSKNAGWADIHYLRGHAFLALGDEVEAGKAYAEALKINPSFADAREALASLGGTGARRSMAGRSDE